MAKVKLNPVIEQVRGQMGELVFRRTREGGTSVMRKPDMSGVDWSAAQIAHRERFRQAIAYARAALADPQARTSYEQAAALKGKRPFELAVSDYFQGQNLLSGVGN